MPSKRKLFFEAAKELFGELGYAETTFKKISDKAGVALGLIDPPLWQQGKSFFWLRALMCSRISIPFLKMLSNILLSGYTLR